MRTLLGQVSDPGSPASGVVTNTVKVNVLDHLGVSVADSQSASMTGSTWQDDYPFTAAAYGPYTVTLYAEDGEAAISTTVGALNLDDIGPSADIAISHTVISESLGTCPAHSPKFLIQVRTGRSICTLKKPRGHDFRR